jgi:hypothetical protein
MSEWYRAATEMERRRAEVGGTIKDDARRAIRGNLDRGGGRRSIMAAFLAGLGSLLANWGERLQDRYA